MRYISWALIHTICVPLFFFLFISSYVCFSFAFWLTQTDIGISQHQHSSGNNNATRHNSIKIEPIMNKMMMNRIQWRKKNLQCMQWQNVWDLFSRSQQILYGNHITQVAMHICSQLFYSMRSIFYNKIKIKWHPPPMKWHILNLSTQRIVFEQLLHGHGCWNRIRLHKKYESIKRNHIQTNKWREKKKTEHTIERMSIKQYAA